ncbi:MAG: insulinase family protein [Proteobacteria bacterium]|nr:insulinase family protein [Pseudomonadota bacterium]HQR03891.1 pitrilysin family protein [Rhodocyclaceae bacterium]
MKRIHCLLVLLAGLLALPAQAAPAIQHWVTPEGVRVYFIENHDLPILDLEIDFAAGGAYAPATKAGLAGLTNGLLDGGIEGLDEEQIAGRLVDLGARLGAAVDADRASLSLRTLSSATERDGALDLMQRILTHPVFPEAIVEREKARAIAALQEADTRPDAIGSKRFMAALYPGHPYGVTPTVDTVARITRDDLIAFHQRYYAARRAVVSLIGDVSRGEAEALVRRLTAGLPAGVADAGLPPVSLPDAATIRIPHPAAQSHIWIGMPALKRGDPDSYALQVGNYTLGGGGFVSRLMKEVREKRGYAYSVYSGFSARREMGPFQIGLQTKREQSADALKVVDGVLSGFLHDGPTPAELEAAKRNLADSLALRTDSNAKLLGYLAVIGFYGLPLDYLDTYPARIRAVTADEVRAAFARHVEASHLVTVIVAGDAR